MKNDLFLPIKCARCQLINEQSVDKSIRPRFVESYSTFVRTFPRSAFDSSSRGCATDHFAAYARTRGAFIRIIILRRLKQKL